MSRRQKHRIPVRLVKGIYWDSKIKLTQVEDLISYPVFMRVVNTDIFYCLCKKKSYAKKMSGAQDALYLQFATHNAYSVAAILTLIDLCYDDYQFKFQNLQNMVKALHYCVTWLKLYTIVSLRN